MEQAELLRLLATVLDRLRVEYFVTGSVASSFYGEPRYTLDVDIVADLSEIHVEPLCRAFSEDSFYISEPAVREAIARRTQFNIIDSTTGLKIDVIVPPRTDHNRVRFARAKPQQPDGTFLAPFATAEDVILKKLEYFRDGGSDKHLRDIASILRVQSDAVDRPYIEHWAARLGVADAWAQVVQRMTQGG